jgi:hypothetical protein
VIPVPALLWNYVNRGNEAVSLACDCLHKTRPLWVITKYITDLADGGVDPVRGVEEDVGPPETIYDFLSRYQVPLFLEEEYE